MTEANPQTTGTFTLPTPNPFQALLFEAVALGQQLRNRGRGLNGEDASGVAMSLMEALWQQGPQTVPQLARTGRTSRQNIQVQVNRLLKGGLVELRNNPSHRKSSLVALSERGREKLEAQSATRNESLRILVSEISEPQLAAACQVLRTIREKMTGLAGPNVGSLGTATEPATTSAPANPPADLAGPSAERSATETRRPFVAEMETEDIPVSLL